VQGCTLTIPTGCHPSTEWRNVANLFEPDTTKVRLLRQPQVRTPFDFHLAGQDFSK
jgi:hypothetical protein